MLYLFILQQNIEKNTHLSTTCGLGTLARKQADAIHYFFCIFCTYYFLLYFPPREEKTSSLYSKNDFFVVFDVAACNCAMKNGRQVGFLPPPKGIYPTHQKKGHEKTPPRDIANQRNPEKKKPGKKDQSDPKKEEKRENHHKQAAEVRNTKHAEEVEEEATTA